MKSMTYAQKADLVAKCKRVFESVKRSNQVAMAEKYKDLAVKAIGYDRYLRDDTLTAFFNMKTAIKNKPRYRYDNKAGKWVECEARNLYVKSIVSQCADLQAEKTAQYLGAMNRAVSPGNTLNALANSYAEQQRRGMAGGACSPASQSGSGVNPLTGW